MFAVTNVVISPGYRSDHSIVELRFRINEFDIKRNVFGNFSTNYYFKRRKL